jgi:glycosyltransferase involved in cell wall biosynthesis
MKVLHINTFDTGGAAIACIRLHLALLESGVDSHLLTLYKSRSDIPNHSSLGNTIRSNKKNSLKSIISSRIQNRLPKIIKNKLQKDKEYEGNVSALIKQASACTDYFSLVESPFNLDQTDLDLNQFDVINLHWVADFLDWETFFTSSRIKNVVWTLHDMSAFTGGYHYAAGYTGYIKDDVNPPFLKDTFDSSFAYKQLSKKKDILLNSNINLKVVSPSKWLRDCSAQSSLFKSLKHYVIPNSVNTRVFRNVSKAFAREVFNIPQDKKIVLFVSDHVQNQRKGFNILLDSLKLLDKQEIVLCSIGNIHQENFNQQNHVHLGRINDERLMAVAYNTADVFVLPSKEDNLPNVVLEALCCGVPVVGFKIGGMTDLVTDGSNGLLSYKVSAQQLASSILSALHNFNISNNINIALDASKKFSSSSQANSYREVYSSF